MEYIYFVDYGQTPSPDYEAIKNMGFDAIAGRISNSGSAGIPYTKFPTEITKIKAAGMTPYGWVWDGFSYSKEVAAMGAGIIIDMETYSMSSKLSQIKQIRSDTTGQKFYICTKPQDWDGDQLWTTIVDYCDGIMPMCYLGDYGKTTSDLTSYLKSYNTKLNGKLAVCLQTYKSDSDITPKTNTVVNEEIAAARDNTIAIAEFRYGSNVSAITEIEGKEDETVTFTPAEIAEAGLRVYNWIKKNGEMPNYVTINELQIPMPQFLYLAAFAARKVGSGSTAAFELIDVAEPTIADYTFTEGYMAQDEIMSQAYAIKTYCQNNSKAPAYRNTTLGKVPYKVLVFTFARITAFIQTYNRLPSKTMVEDVYTDDESDKGEVQTAIEKSIGYSFTTFTEFYNWVKENCDYSYYFNDKYTLQQEIDKKISSLNCVDFSQVGVKLAKEMGYTATLYGIYCTTDKINHAIFKIKGGEFTSDTWVDLSAAAYSDYAIGSHWCSGTLTKEPSWLPYELKNMNRNRYGFYKKVES